MAAGKRRHRLAFHRLEAVDTARGRGASGYSADPFLTVWGGYKPASPSEALGAGAPESRVDGVVEVLSTPETRSITTADVVMIDGEAHGILGITNPDRRGRELRLAVRRGGAV